MTEDRFTNFVQLVTSTARLIADTGPLQLPTNGFAISSVAENPKNIADHDVLQKRFEELKDSFYKLDDPATDPFILYDAFSPPQPLPSQASALLQLQIRALQGQPILAASVAPAGFRKTQLLHNPLHYCKLQHEDWEVSAITNIVAIQLGGSTLHHLFHIAGHGHSRIHDNAEQRQRVSRVRGLVIDEAMMVEESFMTRVRTILQELPLLPSLRRKHSLPDYSFRDIVIGGDLHQLEPSDTVRPFGPHQLPTISSRSLSSKRIDDMPGTLPCVP